MSILETQQLQIGYGKTVLAGPFDVRLQAGQLVCLLGPNGAGKSTLMRTIAGLLPSLAGEIQINKQALISYAPTELAQQMSLVLTDRVQVTHLTVSELVALGRTPYTNWLGTLQAKDKEQIEWAMRVTGVLPYKQKFIQQLSDGERQKVMLARALAQDTDLILLDEPTAHLDLPSRIELMRLLRQLVQQTQKAVLLSTHELDLALQAADQLWILPKTGIVQTGTPEDLVLDGRFENAFPGFDRHTGSFSLPQKSAGQSVALAGTGYRFFWTHRALKRAGYQIDNTATRTIEVTSTHWVINSATTLNSIAELLQFLQS
ncbi:MAG: ABC transporter ATP-binding protein [Siphonobacter sp.]